ncbi:MAG: hypothetical protein AVDCRST_MAG87-2671, partial [uncultured Thermomicrobiales bacterium]
AGIDVEAAPGAGAAWADVRDALDPVRVLGGAADHAALRRTAGRWGEQRVIVASRGHARGARGDERDLVGVLRASRGQARSPDDPDRVCPRLGVDLSADGADPASLAADPTAGGVRDLCRRDDPGRQRPDRERDGAGATRCRFRVDGHRQLARRLYRSPRRIGARGRSRVPRDLCRDRLRAVADRRRPDRHRTPQRPVCRVGTTGEL